MCKNSRMVKTVKCDRSCFDLTMINFGPRYSSAFFKQPAVRRCLGLRSILVDTLLRNHRHSSVGHISGQHFYMFTSSLWYSSRVRVRQPPQAYLIKTSSQTLWTCAFWIIEALSWPAVLVNKLLNIFTSDFLVSVKPNDYGVAYLYAVDRFSAMLRSI